MARRKPTLTVEVKATGAYWDTLERLARWNNMSINDYAAKVLLDKMHKGLQQALRYMEKDTPKKVVKSNDSK